MSASKKASPSPAFSPEFLASLAKCDPHAVKCLADWRGALHSMAALPNGKTIADLFPAFSGIKGEIHIGDPNPECACCRKSFTATRKRRKRVRLYFVATAMHVPIAIDLWVCGRCYAMHERGGNERDAFLAAVEIYQAREEVSQ